MVTTRDELEAAPATGRPAPSPRRPSRTASRNSASGSERHASGGRDAAKKQHDKGKLTARERLDVLMDQGSFVETDPFAVHRAHDFGMDRKRPPGDGITGYGTVDGRKVFVASQDFTVFGGSMGEVMAQKVTKVMDLAMSTGAPFVSINDLGRRAHPGGRRLARRVRLYLRAERAGQRRDPPDQRDHGPCAGGAVYSPAITDFTFMVRESSHMFITGPDVIKTVTGEDVSMEELGGAMTHATKSGVASFVGEDDEDVLNRVRYLLSFLPSNNLEDPPAYAPTDDPNRSADDALTHLVPDRAKEPYDMHEVIRYVVDDGEFLEIFPLWAMNVVIGFARLDGRSIGVIANQPKVNAGTLDIEASEKACASCGSATRSTSRSSRWSTCLGSCPARTRSTTASSATVPSCSTPTPRPPCRE